MLWLVIAAMLGAAMLMLLPPLWRAGGRYADTLDSDTANIEVLRAQLAELEAERDSGVLSPEQYESAREDLQSAAAAELSDEQSDGAQPPQPLSVRARRWLGVGVFVLVSAGSIVMYQGVSTYQETPAAAQTGAEPSVEEMVEILAARLRAQPDNAQGWTMLGRAYAILQNYDQAVGAYAQAYQLGAADNPDLLIDYAEALAFTHEGRMRGQPLELVEQALAIAPAHPKALWLAGFADFQAADYPGALSRWRQVTENPALGEDTRRMLQGYMAEAQSKLDATAQTEDPQADAQTGAAVADTATAGNEAVAIRVEVTIAESLIAQTRPTETVYVFARAVTGPPLPLAVQKLTVADLPTVVTLDDNMAMVEGLNLSSQPNVIVGARVSRSGNPLPQPGDLQGLSPPITPATDTNVTVLINETIK